MKIPQGFIHLRTFSPKLRKGGVGFNYVEDRSGTLLRADQVTKLTVDDESGYLMVMTGSGFCHYAGGTMEEVSEQLAHVLGENCERMIEDDGTK